MSIAGAATTAEPEARSGGSLALLAATVFLSAFLLFQVQPIIGKYILPWFGSTPGVWATALLFFQLMLLAGYAYAHFIVSRLTWRRQAILHALLLALALITLPITPAEALKPTGSGAPSLRILLILTVSVGAPYLLLSATAPLIQGTVMAVFVLLVLEMWRRMEGVALRGWWTSRRGVARVGLTSIAALGLVSLTGGLVWQITNNERRVVEQDRNFYGALAIKERDIGDRGHRLSLTHGRISHGSQLQLFPSWPTTYFGPETGIGLAITHHPKRSDETAQFRIGVVGLGVGTIATRARAAG